ncbi:MAG: DUF3575 domain-containing protein [Prevotellaceae bacterium]|nr:DUF3575 domain-containing protein [Prevotellaceae bacterium]
MFIVALVLAVQYCYAIEPKDTTISGKVIFPVSKCVIPKDAPFLKEFIGKTLPEMQQKKAEVVRMEVVGTASPEGSRAFNKQLSEKRNKALVDTISTLLELPKDIKSEIVIEDYAELVRMMKESNDTYYESVQLLYDKFKDDEVQLKRRLRSLDKGRLWKYILNKYYPDLRSAKVRLYFHIPAQKTQAEIDAEARVKAAEEAQKKAMQDAEILKEYTEPYPKMDSTIVERERVHILSLKTNLLHDAFWMPNYGMAPAVNIHAEYYPLNGHYTYNAAFMFPYYHRWSHQKFFQIRDYELSVRRYFKPAKDDNAEYLGWYLAAYGHFAKYGIGLNKEKGWQGEGGGAGLEIGYVTNISKNKRWRLEFSAGLGFFYTRFDPYVYGNPVLDEEDGKYYYDYTKSAKDFKKRNHKSLLPDPTHIGVTLTYDLLYRRIAKRGVSVHRKEVMK